MLATNMDMRAPVRPLKERPEGFEAIHVNVAPRVFLAPVVNRVVLVAEAGQDAVRTPFVGTNARANRHVLDNRRDQGFAASVGHDPSEKLAVPLKDTKYNRLALGAAAREAFDLRTPAANVGFVNLDMAGHGRDAVNRAHIFPDLVGHAERGRVAHAELALQFLGGNAMPRRCEKIHGIEPLLQRDMGAMEGRAYHWIDFMTAPRAFVSRVAADAMKLSALAAFGAIKRVAMMKTHQVFQTRVIVGKLLEKFLNVWASLHRRILRTHEYGDWSYGCQVYNRVSALVLKAEIAAQMLECLQLA